MADDLSISPTPTDEEAAAIAAAVYVGWPRAVVDEPPAETPTSWRFSGRWWNRPIWGRPQANRRRP